MFIRLLCGILKLLFNYFATALGVSTDYLLTGDIIDKDLLILSEKLENLTPSQVRIVESIIDECSSLFTDNR